MPLGRRWTKEEDTIIRKHYRKDADRDIAVRLGRSLRSIQHRRIKLNMAKISLKRWTAGEDEIIRAAGRDAKKRPYMHRCLMELAQRLGRGISEVSEHSRRIGIKFRELKKRVRKVRGYPVLGCRDKKWLFVHTRNMESRLGRRLLPNERIHHINLDKGDPGIGNLFLCKSISQHRLIHAQAGNLVPELMRRGLVWFDRVKGVYRICETGR